MITQVLAIIFSILTLIPVAFAQEEENSADNHQLFKCNFTNDTLEPNFSSVIADPEWSQVVYVTRKGEVVPVKDVWLRVDLVKSAPTAYIFNFVNRQGQPHVRIQEFYSDPAVVSILNRPPGSFDCYRQWSSKLWYYKRF